MSFSPQSPPVRDGDYTRFVTQRPASLPVAIGSIVALPIRASWGPVGVAVTLNKWSEYTEPQNFGTPIDPTNPDPGYVAAYNAFKGEGPDIRPGAGRVIAFRMGTPVAASKQLKDTANANNILITGKYGGVRGNNLKVEVIANSQNPGTQIDINIYDGVAIVERYRGYAATALTQLQADINRLSSWVVASGAVNGTQLATAAAAALTGGSDGPALTASDWSAAETAFSIIPFGYFAPYDLTDDTIRASLVAWVAGLNSQEKSKRFFLVEGGAAGESFTTAAARSLAADNENVVNLGQGTYHDTALGLDLSTSQLAPRLAGVLAARGDRSGVSFAVLQDLIILSGPADFELTQGLTSGVVQLALGSAGVRIERGVTTYVDDQANVTAKPFSTYSNIKYVTTMQDIDRQNRIRNEDGTRVGLLSVNKDVREQLVADAQKDLDARVAAKTIQPGARAMLSPDVPVSDDDNFVAIDWVAKFGRYLGQVRNSIYIS